MSDVLMQFPAVCRVLRVMLCIGNIPSIVYISTLQDLQDPDDNKSYYQVMVVFSAILAIGFPNNSHLLLIQYSDIYQAIFVLHREITSLMLLPKARSFTCDCKANYSSINMELVLKLINDFIHSNNWKF